MSEQKPPVPAERLANWDTEKAVIERLAKIYNITAALDWPGFIAVAIGPEHRAAFGTVNECWDGDLNDAHGEHHQWSLRLTPPIPSHAAGQEAVEAIADGIAVIVTKWVSCSRDMHDWDSAENLDGGACKWCGRRRDGAQPTPTPIVADDVIEYEVTATRRTRITETWTIKSRTPLDADAIEDIVLGGTRPDGVTADVTDTDEDDDDCAVTAIEDLTHGETLRD